MRNGAPPPRRASAERPRAKRALPSGGPTLRCTAGPATGEEFVLGPGERVIGRANDNAICIQDTSVSRKHVLIWRQGEEWMVKDLGSGNGTLVNGEMAQEDQVLLDGDVITLGDTELTFVEASTEPGTDEPPAASSALVKADASDDELGPFAPPPRPLRARPVRGHARPPPGEAVPALSRKRLALAGVVLVLLLVGLGAVRWQKNRMLAQETAQADAEREAVAQFGSLFQQGKNLVREGKWREALEKFEQLKAKRPDYPSLEDYLDRASKEIPNQDRLSEAQSALGRNALADASRALASVSEDTQLYEQQRALLQDLESRAELRVKEAQVLLESDKPAEAKAIVEDVLMAFPTHRNAKVLLERAQQRLELNQRPVAQPAQAAVPKPWDPAVARFMDGDLTGASALVNTCVAKAARCRELLAQMTEFGKLFKRLEGLDAPALGRLLALDKQITGGRASKMAQTAATRAATIFYKSASAARAEGQWSKAMSYARKVLEAEPGHAGAQSMVAELKLQSKEQYLRAYAMKDQAPEDAIAIFKDVVNMTSPGDELNEKARNWIEKLSR